MSLKKHFFKAIKYPITKQANNQTLWTSGNINKEWNSRDDMKKIIPHNYSTSQQLKKKWMDAVFVVVILDAL